MRSHGERETETDQDRERETETVVVVGNIHRGRTSNRVMYRL